MPIKFEQTRQQLMEVMEWAAGKGPVTQAVQEALDRNYLTFAAALITREVSDEYKNN